MEIGSVKNIPDMIKRVKNRERRLMGFGHRVYKNYDPRAKILKKLAYEVFEVTGKNPLIDIAVELEHIALEDDYFVSHKLYPNVDFYSGIIYQAMGFPMTMFPVLFAIPALRMDGAVGGDGARSGAGHRPAPPSLYGRADTSLPAVGATTQANAARRRGGELSKPK